MKYQRLILLLAAVFFAILPKASSDAGDVYLISLNDVTINPVTAEYISNAIELAEQKKAQALIMELDTPGGLLSSTRAIIKKMMAARVPVIVYVAPSGSRAGSAGVFITYASHVAAMAPSTNIGAAHPVQMGGGGGVQKRTVWDAVRDLLDMARRSRGPEEREPASPSENQETSQPHREKVLHDTIAFVRSLAEQRDRNVKWAEKSVVESASITEQQALEKNVIEIIAQDRGDLLNQLNGRKVTIGDQQVELRTDGAVVYPVAMTWRQKLLNVLADPNIAYFLLLLGFYGLFFEVTHPGIGVPGILGAIFLILAFFSMQMLPTNYAGLALIILGILLFVAEMFVPGFGLPTLGGLVCMSLGLLLLFESHYELMRVSFSLILALTGSTAVITLFLVRAVVMTHRRKVVSGKEGLVGEKGETQTAIHPDRAGKVFVHGELWNAVSKQTIKKHEQVEVLHVQGMTLEVKKAK